MISPQTTENGPKPRRSISQDSHAPLFSNSTLNARFVFCQRNWDASICLYCSYCSYLFVSCQTFEGMPALFEEKWDKYFNKGTSLLSFCETALLSKYKSTSQELLPLTFIHCGLPLENTNTMKIEETVRHNLPRTECWPGPNWPRRGQKYLQNCIQIWKRF